MRPKPTSRKNLTNTSTETSTKIEPILNTNIKNVKGKLGNPRDLIIRMLKSSHNNGKSGAILYINGLVDIELVNNNILQSIQRNISEINLKTLDHLFNEIIAITNIEKAKTLDKVIDGLLSGNTVLILDGIHTVLLIETAGGEKRSIEEPPSEPIIQGPREGFIEDINVNIALIRKDIKDSNLRFKSQEIGKRSKQKVIVAYIEGVANTSIVDEVNKRLSSIDTDYVLDSGEVEQWIEDSFLSPLPQIFNTERPDRVKTALMQGKVVVLVDGTPFTLIIPITFADSFRAIEDTNHRWLTGTILRLLRYLSAFIAIFAPALYIALVNYHPDMLPTELVFSIQASREGVPFPAIVEVFIMAITFEILHEAGIRLPRLIGATIGIVGGLVIGDAAVNAGIVSPIMVIVTAITAIASFTIPQYSVAVAFRSIRFIFMVAAGILGLYGIVLVYIMLNIHIVNLKSFGVPYSAPFAPTQIQDWKSIVFRAPIATLTKRPTYLATADDTRSNKNKGAKRNE